MKKLLFLISFLLLVFAPQISFSCFNGMDREIEAAIRRSLKKFPVPYGHRIRALPDKFLADTTLRKWSRDFGPLDESLLIGLNMVYDKRYAEAEKIFARRIKRNPNDYTNAANYGTILEVMGKPEEALIWIKKALELDSTSHEGSEWIHIAILEWKLKNLKNCIGSEITGVDFGPNPNLETALKDAELKKLQHDLFYQLNERLTFIDPPDPVIAALLFELGNATLALSDSSHAYTIYRKSYEYGLNDKLILARMQAARPNQVINLPPDTFVPPNVLPDSAAYLQSYIQVPLKPQPKRQPLRFIGMLLSGAMGAFTVRWMILRSRKKAK